MVGMLGGEVAADIVFFENPSVFSANMQPLIRLWRKNMFVVYSLLSSLHSLTPFPFFGPVIVTLGLKQWQSGRRENRLQQVKSMCLMCATRWSQLERGIEWLGIYLCSVM